MKLVTTWFGTFITDDEGQVTEKCLFPKDGADIAARLEQMQRGEILAEEEELVAGRDVFVREKRLAILGTVLDFQQPDIRPEHFGFGQEILGMAMLSRGRDKVRASASPDEHIVQAIRTIDDLGKIINLMSERLHEWHELNFPELTKLVPESKYVELIAEYGDRNSILESGKIDYDNSMGGEVTEADARAMQSLAVAMIAAIQKKAEMEKYIELRMKDIAPNTAYLVGPLIGARLISLTGGLDRLSKLPASTVQLLGAEKALFKHIKDNAKPPKHGVIFQHPLIHRAPQWQRGKIARTFAGKISIAVKMDRFGGKFIGPELETQLNKRVEDIRKKNPKPKVKGGYRKR
jgi:nucleolar protein 56